MIKSIKFSHIFAFMFVIFLMRNVQYEMPSQVSHIVNFSVVMLLVIQSIKQKYSDFFLYFFFFFFIVQSYPLTGYVQDGEIFNKVLSGPYFLIYMSLFLFNTLLSVKGGIHSRSPVYILVALGVIATIQGLLNFDSHEYFLYDTLYFIVLLTPLALLLNPKKIHLPNKEFLLNRIFEFVVAYAFYAAIFTIFKYASGHSYYEMWFSFGPLNFLILVFLLYFLLIKKGGERMVAIAAIVFYIPVKIISINSHEILLFMVIAVFFLLNYGTIVNKLMVLILSTVFVVFFITSESAWIVLKKEQILILYEILYSNPDLIPNSVFIRLLEFKLLVNEFLTSMNVFLGLGHGAVIHDTNNIMLQANLHDATFPINEINSGKYHGFHESIIKLLIRYGVLGSFIYFYFYILIWRKYKKTRPSKGDRFLFTMLIMLSVFWFGWGVQLIFLSHFILAFLYVSQLKESAK